MSFFFTLLLNICVSVSTLDMSVFFYSLSLSFSLSLFFFLLSLYFQPFSLCLFSHCVSFYASIPLPHSSLSLSSSLPLFSSFFSHHTLCSPTYFPKDMLCKQRACFLFHLYHIIFSFFPFSSPIVVYSFPHSL